jgi:hypothetical protein
MTNDVQNNKGCSQNIEQTLMDSQYLEQYLELTSKVHEITLRQWRQHKGVPTSLGSC